MYVDRDLETAVIGCMLLSEDLALDYQLLNVDDFYHEETRKMYIGISNLVKENKEVDILTLNKELKGAVEVATMAKAQSSVPTATYFNSYIKELKDLTLKRKLYELSGEIRDERKSGEELAELAEDKIFKLREDSSSEDFTKINEFILDVYQDIEQVATGEKERGIRTGYTKLDEIIGGLRKQEYILLGARPSIGKTALATNIAENLLLQDKTIAFFSYEMSKEQLTERILSSLAMVETGYKRSVSAEEWSKLQKAAGYIKEKDLYIDDDPTKSVAEMQSMCRRLKRRKGLDLVIIDYLQKIRSTTKGNKREQLEQVSNDIKNMAKNLDVPVLVVSSLSRANTQRDVKMPMMSDLRETGQLEFDADVIVFLHRDYYYDRSDESKKRLADIAVAKNRNGKVGITKLHWVEEYTKFLDPERSRR